MCINCSGVHVNWSNSRVPSTTNQILEETELDENLSELDEKVECPPEMYQSDRENCIDGPIWNSQFSKLVKPEEITKREFGDDWDGL